MAYSQLENTKLSNLSSDTAFSIKHSRMKNVLANHNRSENKRLQVTKFPKNYLSYFNCGSSPELKLRYACSVFVRAVKLD